MQTKNIHEITCWMMEVDQLSTPMGLDISHISLSFLRRPSEPPNKDRTWTQVNDKRKEKRRILKMTPASALPPTGLQNTLN